MQQRCSRYPTKDARVNESVFTATRFTTKKNHMPSNTLHAAFRDATAEAEQLRLIAESPSMLEEEDDSWEKWLPLHNAARWGVSGAAVRAALTAYPDAAKISSKGGYEALHLAAMGGHTDVVSAIVEMYPEGALKKDNNGRTPLDEAREGSSPEHESIVELLLALPGLREADEAEQQLRAARYLPSEALPTGSFPTPSSPSLRLHFANLRV